MYWTFVAPRKSSVTTQTKKTFDCVQMKRDIQNQLLDEYKAVADRYESYWKFLQDKNRNDPKFQALRQSLGFSSPSSD